MTLVAIASALKAELSISSELNAAQTIAKACEAMGIMRLMRRSCSVKTHRLHAPLNSRASDITMRRSEVRAASYAAYILPRGGVRSSFRAWRADSIVRPTCPINGRVPP